MMIRSEQYSANMKVIQYIIGAHVKRIKIWNSYHFSGLVKAFSAGIKKKALAMMQARKGPLKIEIQ